jgi:glycosidase
MKKPLFGAAMALSLTACVDGELGRTRAITVATHPSATEWRDEIIYQLLTDRFANGDAATDHRVLPGALGRYQGGDWQGIIDRLDYLEELGVTTLWISPIVLNVDADAGYDAYHGYWAVDLTRLNPHFGDLATLRELVAAAHDRNILVVLDIVTNHLGQVFFYDINGNGSPDESVIGSGTRSPLSRISEYDPDYDPRGIQAFTSLGESGPAEIRFFDMPEIFRVPPTPAIFREIRAYNRRGRIVDYGIPEQVVLGDFPGGLKDLNTLDPDVQEALIQSYVDWVLTTDLDGFRIDTLKHVEHEFWQVFAPEVRRRLAESGKTDFFMFGEAFDGDDALLGSYTRPGELDSVFYFSQKYRVFSNVFGRGERTSEIEDLYALRDVNYGTVPQPGGIDAAPRDVLVNFMDNHDVARFLYEFPDPRRLRAALAYLLTEDGIPCLYYGTEQEFSGGNDPANREPLWWSGYDTSGETFQWIARLTRIRRGYRAFTHGSFGIRWVTDHVGTESDAGMLAFERSTPEGDYGLVVINSREAAARTSFGGTTMTVTRTPGETLVDVLTNEEFVVGAGGALEVACEPLEARVLVPAAQRIPGL